MALKPRVQVAAAVAEFAQLLVCLSRLPAVLLGPVSSLGRIGPRRPSAPRRQRPSPAPKSSSASRCWSAASRECPSRSSVKVTVRRAPSSSSEPATLRPSAATVSSCSWFRSRARLSPGRARPTAGCGSSGPIESISRCHGSHGFVRPRSVTVQVVREPRSYGARGRPSPGTRLGGRLTRRGPSSEHGGHYAGRGPVPASQASQRVLAAPAGVGSRPVVGRRPPAVALAPLQHRRDHQLPRPLPPDRAGMTALAVGVGVALAVARLGVSAAAAAYALVAGLDRPRLLPGRVLI